MQDLGVGAAPLTNGSAVSVAEAPALPPLMSSGVREIVRAEHVGYTYPSGTNAVTDVTLSIRKGEALGIVGPSGCGKSTLLRMIAGLVLPTTGIVSMAPEAASATCAISMVFQNDTLVPWMRVRDNAALYKEFQSRRERRRTAGERESRVEELLAMVGLEKFADAYPYELSGGMKRRLAFVAAVAPSPSLLLLDEPFSSVDEPTQIQIHRDVLRIIKQLDMTVVLVTHNLAEAATLCDRVVIMTNHPGTIYTEHVMTLPADRDLLRVRRTDEFHELYSRLWADLSKQIAAHSESEDKPA